MSSDIRVYDFEFNLLMVTGKYKSIHWDIYYNKIGTVELHLGLNSPLLPLLFKNKYLIIRQDVKKTAIITGKIIDAEVILYGRTCNWILTRRSTPDFDQITGTVEGMTRNFVSTAFSDVANFVLGKECGITESIKFWRNTRNPTFDVVSECLDNSGAGHEVIFDIKNKQWIYQVLKGKKIDFTLSESNKNAYETQISEDFLDLYTCGYYEKQIESTGTDLSVDSQKPQSEWIYIEGNTAKTGIYRWEAVLSGSNQSEAKTSLKNKKQNHETTLKTRNICWGIEYDLGDIVRIQIIKGDYRQSEKKRIVGVSTWFEKGAAGEGRDYGEMPILEDLEEE